MKPDLFYISAALMDVRNQKLRTSPGSTCISGTSRPLAIALS